MSAKLPYSLTDENPDLHKQIGCMNGILQLFDRHHFLAGRHIRSRNHKRLPPGQSSNHGMEPNSTRQQATGKKLEAVKEKQGVSVESSRTSFSSSCSSTFSSVDCNKIAQLEPSSLSHSKPSQGLPIKQPNSSLYIGQQSPDLRDVVKNSICREKHGLSVKTVMKANGEIRVVKHVASPRLMELSKSAKPTVSGQDGSFRVPAKIREAPQSFNKGMSRALSTKDAPRFSYDGRESRDSWKSSTKQKELPRLSLDSREQSIRRFASECTSKSLLDNLQQGNGKSSQTLNPHHEPGSNKRPSSVVAKLMGLEAFEDDQIKEIKCCPDLDLDTTSTSSRKADISKYHKASSSLGTPQREPASPQLGNVNLALKPKSRIPLETATWRQPDENRGSHKQAFISQELHKKSQNSYPSVYGEIEKRLTTLEFKGSGKDLRALKQILEAMEKTRERLENKKEDCASDSDSQTGKHGPNYLNFHQNSTLAMQHGQITPTIKETGLLKKFESSIVIMKPDKVVQKSRNIGSSAFPIEGISGLQKLRTRDNSYSRKDLVDKRTAKDLTPRNNHFREASCQPAHSMDKRTNTKTFRSTQTSKVPQLSSGGNPASSRSNSTVSPRRQQTKHAMDKQSRPTSQISDSSGARRHLSRQQITSGSPRRKIKPQWTNLQESDDRLSEFSSETRHLSHHGDAISEQSESSISLASQTDVEVTSIDRSKERNCSHQHKEIAARLSKHGSKAEPKTATLEKPSPVSVFDFYREESPSPVKKISNAFKDEETLNSDEAEWNLSDLDHFLNNTRPNLSTQFDQERVENIKYLTHAHKQVSSTCDEAATDHVAALFENTIPDHRYIAEILLASGILLKDLGSSSTIIQLHPSGHSINPSLFLDLEKTKGRIELSADEHSIEKIGQSKLNEKIRRKLMFDTVNEILVCKLTSAVFSEPWTSPNKLGVRSLSGQKLLKELCSEMDHLQAKANCGLSDVNDMMRQTQNWADYHTEVPGVVLYIERLIFKDLICEIVSGEASAVQGQPTKHCRQLFSN
ncbi:Protein LONGIFOLIA like [Actinidia chinensis var. chinensis]|uniref:Protein LONGIFOLIA like n=1 Tax=Actinidia chinensis var. chinensis TaxID=1590841 RepID=A0A2R6RUE8_ACTCC|nr:Protein LONGIFOLIA like [Actinidia chinensis var. chinensis]